jgi:L-ascorbate metabolism protein UlaG (beta-lactamase superfamily)
MPARLTAHPRASALAAHLAAPAGAELALHWLGQAGFVIEGAGRRLVIDPYLSDSLARKYAGRLYPHERMMAAPVSPLQLGAVDLVLSTHQHTDHMDPDSLAPLLAQQPHLRLVAPRACRDEARRRAGIGDERLLLVDAGERIAPLPGVAVIATRAAHETLERDQAGRHRFLGYVIEIAGCRIWHAGDTVPFDGMVAEVAALEPDIALLPVNGRSAALLANGVPGNLALDEAIGIGRDVGARAIIAHHFGMFEFNTADPATIDQAAMRLAENGAGTRLLRAALDTVYRWESNP